MPRIKVHTTTTKTLYSLILQRMKSINVHLFNQYAFQLNGEKLNSIHFAHTFNAIVALSHIFTLKSMMIFISKILTHYIFCFIYCWSIKIHQIHYFSTHLWQLTWKCLMKCPSVWFNTFSFFFKQTFNSQYFDASFFSSYNFILSLLT